MLYTFAPKAWQASVVRSGASVWRVWLTSAVDGESEVPRPSSTGTAAQLPLLASGVRAEMWIAN